MEWVVPPIHIYILQAALNDAVQQDVVSGQPRDLSIQRLAQVRTLCYIAIHCSCYYEAAAYLKPLRSHVYFRLMNR